MRWELACRPHYTLLIIRLEAGESVAAGAGATVLVRGGVRVRTSAGGFGGALNALAGRDSTPINRYEAEGPAELWLAPPYPGDIAHFELREGLPALLVSDSSYLASYGDVRVTVVWRGFKGLMGGGAIPTWLRVEGEGDVWVAGHGVIREVVLGEGERVMINGLHFVAMTETLGWQVRRLGGLRRPS